MSVTEILSHLNRPRGKEHEAKLQRMMTERHAHMQYRRNRSVDGETITTSSRVRAEKEKQLIHHEALRKDLTVGLHR